VDELDLQTQINLAAQRIQRDASMKRIELPTVMPAPSRRRPSRSRSDWSKIDQMR